VREMFPKHVMSRFGDVALSPRSPDLSACDFPMALFEAKGVCEWPSHYPGCEG
jgi:hypothetical protein